MALKKTKRKAFNFLRSYFDVYNQLEKDSDKLKFLDSILNKQFLNEDPVDLEFVPNLCYESQRHAIESSVKGWLRVNNIDVMTDPTIDPTTDPTTNPEEEEEEEEVKGEEEGEGEDPPTPVFNFKKSLLNYGFKKELVNDFMKIRKNKNATNTETALNAFIKQIEKTGREKNEVFKIIVEKGWKGFEAEWLKNPSFGTKPVSPHHNVIPNANYDEKF